MDKNWYVCLNEPLLIQTPLLPPPPLLPMRDVTGNARKLVFVQLQAEVLTKAGAVLNVNARWNGI
jgi:hypothetical protein